MLRGGAGFGMVWGKSCVSSVFFGIFGAVFFYSFTLYLADCYVEQQRQLYIFRHFRSLLAAALMRGGGTQRCALPCYRKRDCYIFNLESATLIIYEFVLRNQRCRTLLIEVMSQILRKINKIWGVLTLGFLCLY